MNIDSLTIGDVKQIKSLLSSETQTSHPYRIGKNYFVRTVTHYYVGRLVAVHAQELVIENASWIADTGRFHVALQDGIFDEIEPYPIGQVVIGRGSIIDASLYTGELPQEAK